MKDPNSVVGIPYALQRSADLYLAVMVRMKTHDNPISLAVARVALMPIGADEIELNEGRFSRYVQAPDAFANKVRLQFASTAQSTPKGNLADWFRARIEWVDEKLMNRWSIFIPDRYDHAICNVDFLFSDVQDAVHFALRWKGEV